MSQHPDLNTRNVTDTSDKKMVRGSFAISLLVHGLILLLIGSIIIVPGVVREMAHIVPVAPTPTVVPEAPKMEEEASESKADDASGSPIGDVPDPSSTSTTPDASVDALAVVSPVSTGPSMNATPGASSVPGAFSDGKAAIGGGNGTEVGGRSGPGLGKGAKTFFGSREKFEGSLVGRFYDKTQDRARKPILWDQFGIQTMKEFISSGFAPSKLNRYFSAPQPLYTSSIMMPLIRYDEAPKAFSVEKEVNGKEINWLVHYQAMVAPTVDGTYRFVGNGGPYLIIGVNDKVVLDGSLVVYWDYVHPGQHVAVTDWKNSDPRFPAAMAEHNRALVPGDWIEWKANDYRKLDIVISDRSTVWFWAYLLIEEKGKNYQMCKDGSPILPVFRVSTTEVEMPPDVDKRNYPEFIMGPVFKAQHVK